MIRIIIHTPGVFSYHLYPGQSARPVQGISLTFRVGTVNNVRDIRMIFVTRFSPTIHHFVIHILLGVKIQAIVIQTEKPDLGTETVVQNDVQAETFVT